MLVGIALEESEHPERDATLRALDAWIGRSAAPDMFAIWARREPSGWGWSLDHHLLTGIRERGIIPIVYVESTGFDYAAIRAGKHDHELRFLACRIGDGTRFRWDQEADGTGLRADWQRPKTSAQDYVGTWRHVYAVMHSEADVRMFWCGSGPLAGAEAWFPGPDFVDVVGFDRFSRDEAGRFPPVQWQRDIGWLNEQAPGKEKGVGESGRLEPLTRRAEYLRSLDEVQGLDFAVVFDRRIVIPDKGIDDDWTWDRPMKRAFAERQQA